MGGPCDRLVPAAVLYDNPQGLSFEEFFARVNFIAENLKPKEGFPDMHYIIENKYAFAAGILHTPHTNEYDLLINSYFDKDLQYHREEFFPQRNNNFIVRKENRKLIDKEIVLDTFSRREGNKENKYICDEPPENYPEEYSGKNIDFLVLKVLESRIEDEGHADEPYFYEKVLVHPVLIEKKEEVFHSDKELIKKYPEYALRNVYDFSVDKGLIYPSNKEEPPVFCWKKKGGKYFLDVKFMLDRLSLDGVYTHTSRTHETSYSHIDRTFDWVHDIHKGGFSLTDLVLTCEAIRKENWKILNYCGVRYELLKFLYSNPDVFERYEKSVLDAELSTLAEKEGKTHFEFLWEYSEMTHKRKFLDLKVARQELDEFVKKETKEKRLRQLEFDKEAEEENKNPF